MVVLYYGFNGYYEWVGIILIEVLVFKYILVDGINFDWNNLDYVVVFYDDWEVCFYVIFLFDGVFWKLRMDDVVKFDKFNEI